MEQFQLEVVCNAGGTPHTHVIVVEHASGAFGASRPGNVRLQVFTGCSRVAHILDACRADKTGCWV